MVDTGRLLYEKLGIRRQRTATIDTFYGQHLASQKRERESNRMGKPDLDTGPTADDVEPSAQSVAGQWRTPSSRASVAAIDSCHVSAEERPGWRTPE